MTVKPAEADQIVDSPPGRSRLRRGFSLAADVALAGSGIADRLIANVLWRLVHAVSRSRDGYLSEVV
jgi:hypothetical protein